MRNDAAGVDELLEKVAWMRDLTGRPVGVKTAVGGWRLMNEAADIIHRRGLEFAPDFLVIDGGEIRKLATLLELSQALAGSLNLQTGLYGALEVLEHVRGAVADARGEGAPGARELLPQVREHRAGLPRRRAAP